MRETEIASRLLKKPKDNSLSSRSKSSEYFNLIALLKQVVKQAKPEDGITLYLSPNGKHFLITTVFPLPEYRTEQASASAPKSLKDNAPS
jgi:hypothetical protein